MSLFSVEGPRNIEVKSGPIYDNLNQDDILSHFTHLYPAEPKKVAVIYLFSQENPLILPKKFGRVVRAFPRKLKEVLRKQHCVQLDAPFNPRRLPDFNGRSAKPIGFAHIIAHMLLPYAQRYAIHNAEISLPSDFEFQEIVYENKFNPLENRIVFNFPCSVHVGTLTERILVFMEKWIKGQRANNFFGAMISLDEEFQNERAFRSKA